MVGALIRKSHVVAINMYQTNLKAKIIEVATSDGFILQVKEGLLASPIKGKYEAYQVNEYGLLLYKG